MTDIGDLEDVETKRPGKEVSKCQSRILHQ